MTTLNEQSPASFGTTIVSGADTSPSHPPLLAVGPLAWIKKNLFIPLATLFSPLSCCLLWGHGRCANLCQHGS